MTNTFSKFADSVDIKLWNDVIDHHKDKKVRNFIRKMRRSIMDHQTDLEHLISIVLRDSCGRGIVILVIPSKKRHDPGKIDDFVSSRKMRRSSMDNQLIWSILFYVIAVAAESLSLSSHRKRGMIQGELTTLCPVGRCADQVWTTN
jgi:hypothetical protein